MSLFETMAVWDLSEAFLKNLALLIVLVYAFGLIVSRMEQASRLVR